MFFASKHPQKRIAVLSDDVNLRLKAKSNKIEAFGAKEYFGQLYVQPSELNKQMTFEQGTKKPFQQKQQPQSSQQIHNHGNFQRKPWNQNHNYNNNNNQQQQNNFVRHQFTSPQGFNKNSADWISNNQKTFEFGKHQQH